MLIALLPTLVVKSVPAFAQELRRLVRRKTSMTQHENGWHADKEAHGWTSTCTPKRVQ